MAVSKVSADKTYMGSTEQLNASGADMSTSPASAAAAEGSQGIGTTNPEEGMDNAYLSMEQEKSLELRGRAERLRRSSAEIGKAGKVVGTVGSIVTGVLAAAGAMCAGGPFGAIAGAITAIVALIVLAVTTVLGVASETQANQANKLEGQAADYGAQAERAVRSGEQVVSGVKNVEGKMKEAKSSLAAATLEKSADADSAAPETGTPTADITTDGGAAVASAQLPAASPA